MKKILSIGNALADIITPLKNDDMLSQLNFPRGSMQLINDEQLQQITLQTAELEKRLVSGGSAANTICGIAQLGVETGFIGKVGNDPTGIFFSSDLEKNGVKPILKLSEQPSGRCIALISPGGERTFCTYLGAACELNAQDMTPEMFEGYDIVHIEGYLIQNFELIETAMKSAKGAGAKISVDLASFNVVEANREYLLYLIETYVDVVFANEEEAYALTQQQPEAAVYAIAEISNIAVVKIGEKGSIVKKGNEIFHIDPIKANCIDTTGAGDLYAAGFLFGLANWYPLSVCGKLGSLLSGNVVEVFGAKMDSKRWSEIKLNIASILHQA